jgi:hypothetical protein
MLPEHIIPRVEKIVPLYDGQEDFLVDCLTDLMHWAETQGLDFGEAMAIAEIHHVQERSENA